MPPAAPDAYRRCRELAHSHYENFPVASRVLPRRLRNPVAVIYVFARRADDHADEGDHPPAERLARLDAMAQAFDQTVIGRAPPDPLWEALADAIPRYQLPLAPFRDLLSAFRQDVTCDRYATFNEVRDYCRRSANPIGRLLLHLNGTANAINRADADRICTALQLINFLQDLSQDFIDRGRLYIPQADLTRFGVAETELASGQPCPAVEALLATQIERAADWLYAGRELPARLPGRFGLEIKLIVRGGWRIIERLRAAKPVAPLARPRLERSDRRWIARGLLPGAALAGVTPPSASASAWPR